MVFGDPPFQKAPICTLNAHGEAPQVSFLQLRRKDIQLTLTAGAPWSWARLLMFSLKNEEYYEYPLVI